MIFSNFQFAKTEIGPICFSLGSQIFSKQYLLGIINNWIKSVCAESVYFVEYLLNFWYLQSLFLRVRACVCTLCSMLSACTSHESWLMSTYTIISATFLLGYTVHASAFPFWYSNTFRLIYASELFTSRSLCVNKSTNRERERKNYHKSWLHLIL